MYSVQLIKFLGSCARAPSDVSSARAGMLHGYGTCTLPSGTTIRSRVPLAISYELGEKLARQGLAIPGFEDVALTQGGARAAERLCTIDAPCDFDVLAFLSSLVLSPAGIALVVLLSYSAGGAAADGQTMASLEQRSQVSRQRRDDQLRAFAERLRPLQSPPFGWRVIDDDGFPTLDAWVFLAIAAMSQGFLAWWLLQLFS